MTNVRFAAFNAPRFTQTPDELFDHIMGHLTGAQLKCLLYIIRRTFGFRRVADAISLSQFERGITLPDGTQLDEGTLLDRETIINALRDLADAGYILVERRWTPGGRQTTTVYRLNLAGVSDSTEPEDPAREDVPPANVEPETPVKWGHEIRFARAGESGRQHTGTNRDKQESPGPLPLKVSTQPTTPPRAARDEPPRAVHDHARSTPPDPAAAEPTADAAPAFEQLADDERATLSTLGNRLQRWKLGRWDFLRLDLLAYAHVHRLSALQLQRLIDLASQDDRDKPRSLDELLKRCDLLGPGLFRAWRGVSRAAA